jgi:hypothetical protein
MNVSNRSPKDEGILSEMSTAIAGTEALQLARLDEEQRDLTYQ